MLPQAVKAWREARGQIECGRPWTQKDLADRTGGHVSASLIALIETGDRQPSRLNAEAIAEALGVQLEAIAFVYPDPVVVEVA